MNNEDTTKLPKPKSKSLVSSAFLFFCPLITYFTTDITTLSQSKQKLRRFKMNKTQLTILKEAYGKNKYTTPEQRKQFSRMLGVSDEKVARWFVNRRYEERKKLKEKKQSEYLWKIFLSNVIKGVRVKTVLDLLKYMDKYCNQGDCLFILDALNTTAPP